MEIFNYKEIETSTKEFSLSSLIGKGSHGCVYKGILKGGKLIVAIKKPSKGLQLLQDNTKLDNEIDILSSLHRKNPYIVNLVGVSQDSLTHKKLLVMEFMSNGSLYDLLHNSLNPPTWSKRLHIVLQLARAIQLLHESKPSIIHRDIKSANILFDSNWNPKLADFGLAVKLHTDPDSVLSQKPSQPAGTIGYLDPSYTTPWKLSTKNDVFSFGVVLLEIISCRRVIDMGMEPSSIIDWALPLIQNRSVTTKICDSRIKLPTNMLSSIQCILDIAVRCVSLHEEDRPTMREIVAELETTCVIKPTQYKLWRNIFWITFMGRNRKPMWKTTIVKCDISQEEEVPRKSEVLSIRDILEQS